MWLLGRCGSAVAARGAADQVADHRYRLIQAEDIVAVPGLADLIDMPAGVREMGWLPRLLLA